MLEWGNLPHPLTASLLQYSTCSLSSGLPCAVADVCTKKKEEEKELGEEGYFSDELQPE